MPAFSKFTGLASVETGRDDRIYAILPGDPARGVAASLMKIQ
jgi:hypothetical protein